MELIPNPRVRAAAFARRKKTLRKWASELSSLCGVQVALVVAPADADAAPDAAEVWESEPGAVPARYRAARDARARQGGPDDAPRPRPLDEYLDAAVATPEAAARLLARIDAALRAADERRRALGMPPFFGEDRGAGHPQTAPPDAGLGYVDTPSAHAPHGGCFCCCGGGGKPFFAAGASGDVTGSSLAMGTIATTAGGSSSPPALSLAMDTGGDDDDLANVPQPQPLAMSCGGDLMNAGGYADPEDTQCSLRGS